MIVGLLRVISFVLIAVWVIRKVRRVIQYRYPAGKQSIALDPYEVLGLSPGASEEEIRKAYRSQLQSYHPDKVARLGKEIQDLAEEKTEQIIWAYQVLLKK